MSYQLFLDDVRQPKDCISYMYGRVGTLNMAYATEWVVVKNYGEFVKTIEERGLPSLVSFDHDLAIEHYAPESVWDNYDKSIEWHKAQNYKEKTGEDCAKWLTKYCLSHNKKLPTCLVHSMNPVGCDKILASLLKS